MFNGAAARRHSEAVAGDVKFLSYLSPQAKAQKEKREQERERERERVTVCMFG